MSLNDLSQNKRCVEIFTKLVELYVETGEPVGSRSLSKVLTNPLSPATIRNVMSDLEDLGILCSDHVSAGRKPTDKGWRFFVNGLIETTDISKLERDALTQITKNAVGKSVESILENATDVLSNLSNCVSLIMTPTFNAPVKHIDFILLSPGRAIVVIVNANGVVENRLIDVPLDVSAEVLEQTTNYINSKLSGLSLEEIRNAIQDEVNFQKEGIDKLAKTVLSEGLGFIASDNNDKVLIKGHSNLIANASEINDLRELLKELDEKRTIKTILDQSVTGKGVQIFIGAETKMFEMAGCSMIVSPYRNAKKNLVGVIGILGPSRMKYSRVITLVDYTAKLLGGLV